MRTTKLMKEAITNREYVIARTKSLDDNWELRYENVQKGYYIFTQKRKEGRNMSWKDKTKKRKAWM